MAKAKRLPSGNWHIAPYSHMENGKRIYESFTASTKEEVEYMEAEFKFKKKKEGARKADKLEITVGEAIDAYIASKSNILSPTTLDSYRSVRKYALPDLMKIKLKNLTREKLQEEINKEVLRLQSAGKTLSPKTIKNEYRAVTPALRMYGVSLGKIDLPRVPDAIVVLPPPESILGAIRGTSIELPCLIAM